MRRKSRNDELARRQHGIVSRSQLLSAGRHPSQIDRELAAHRLHRVHAGTLDRRPSRRLRDCTGDETLTQTDLEDLFLKLCRRHRIPTPISQYGVKPRVDFIWPDRRLVVEVDGWEAHRTRAAFQDDRTTTNALQLQGFLVLRYTHQDVTRRAALVAAQVTQALRLS